MHKMLADFNQTVLKNPKAGENPYSKSMDSTVRSASRPRKLCRRKRTHLPKVHTLRAKEAEGQ
jgi:hypothetical protein